MGEGSRLSPAPSPGQEDAVTPQVGVDADGDAVLAWILNETDGSHDFTETQARTRSAAGALSPVQAIRPGAYDFRLAVNGAGTFASTARPTPRTLASRRTRISGGQG